MSAINKGHIDGLDGLRAIAVLGVIFYHMFPFTIKGGFLGVSLFFVLSGFLIAVTGERGRMKRSFALPDFYKRRLMRIYPPLLIVVFVTVGLFDLLAPFSVQGIRGEVLSIVFGYNNWWQILQDSSYFTKIANASPFTHMWSLSLELQFYLVWPLIYFWYIFFSHTGGAKKSAWGITFLILLAALSIFGMAAFYRPGEDATRVYYGTDTRVYAILFGIALGMIYANRERWTVFEKSYPIMFAGLLSFVIVAFLFMDGQSAITYLGGMQFITLVFCMLIVLCFASPVGKWLEWKPLAWLGRRSYEMYLWMYPVIFFFHVKRWTHLPFSGALQLGIILVLSAWLHFLVGVLVHWRQWFKGGIIRMKVKQVSFVMGAAAFAVMFVLGGCATATSGTKNSDAEVVEKELEEAAKQLEEAEQQEDGALEEAAQQGSDAEEAAQEGDSALEQATGEADSSGDSAQGETVVAEENAAGKQEEEAKELENPLEDVTCIGDSVMLGASGVLKDSLPKKAVVDAKESRQVKEAKEIAKTLSKKKKLKNMVVLALGTNGAFKKDVGQELIDFLGEDRTIFWVNVYGMNLQWEEETNETIEELAEENKNVSVIDWCSMAKDSPEWFYQDGIHLKPTGQRVYAQLILDHLIEAADME